jgi:hypothetical protein
VGQAKVVQLHPLDDTEALACLTEEIGSSVETSVTELARKFGWPPTRMRRRLETWVKAGQITKNPTRNGKFTVAPSAEMLAIDRIPDEKSAMRIVGRAFGDPLSAAANDQNGNARAHRGGNPAAQRSILTIAAAALLFATAIGMAGVGLVMNARFAASFGQTVEAAALLTGIGLAIDVLAIVMPTAAAQLWHNQLRPAAAAAWLIWTAALSMTLLAAIGFASTNIGDAVAGRARIATENVTLAERIGQLRQERNAITELRSADAIEIELQRAQPLTQGVWAITNGCRDVTRTSSARACTTVLQLREAQANALRRDTLDANLREAQAKLAILPAITDADPQTKSAAEFVTWVSGGWFNPQARDIGWLRTIGLILTPSLAGLVAMLAFSLIRLRRV